MCGYPDRDPDSTSMCTYGVLRTTIHPSIDNGNQHRHTMHDHLSQHNSSMCSPLPGCPHWQHQPLSPPATTTTMTVAATTPSLLPQLPTTTPQRKRRRQWLPPPVITTMAAAANHLSLQTKLRCQHNQTSNVSSKTYCTTRSSTQGRPL